ncbi:zinc finger, CCHC-type containing protein, partial [Tanacetum coccineum]
GLCGLIPYSDSDSDLPDEMSSPEHISLLRAISPLLCIDSSEAPDSFDGPPSQDPYVATVARWRSRVTTRTSSPHEFPIAPVTAPPGIHRRSATLIRPGEAIPFGRPYRTHLNGPRKLLTARKRVRPLPACRLASRHASPRSPDHHLIHEDGENATMEQIRKRNKWENDDYVCRGLILNDFNHTLKHKKEELALVKFSSYLRIEESLRMHDSDKPKGNNVVGPSIVNMVEHNNSIRYNDNKGKRKHQGTKADPNKNSKVYYVTYISEAYFVHDNDVAWWVDSGATVHVCKDRCWFKIYESLNDGSIFHMGNESTALVHGRGCVDLRFSSGKIVSLFNYVHVPNIRKNLVSSSILNNCGYKQVTESDKFVLSKHGVFIGFGYLCNQIFRLNIVNDIGNSAFMSTFKLNDSILWHARPGHVHFKRMQDMSKDGLIPAFDMDTEKCKTCMLTKITKKPFQNVKRKTEVLELIHSDLCDLHATPSLGNKKYFMTFIDDASKFCYVYLLHTKDEALDEFKVCKTEVELQQGSMIKRFKTDRGGEYMDTLYF